MARVDHLLTPRVVGRHLGALVLGAVVGVVGTGVHRAERPLGLALALLAVLLTGVLTRAWIGWSGMLAAALGTMAVVGVLGATGPGGDVLIALDPIGLVWYFGAAAVAVAGLLPRRWFADRPVGREVNHGSAGDDVESRDHQW